MIDQRAQDGGRGSAAERTDERPVIIAGLPLPAAVTGAHPRGVVEKVLGPCKHENLTILGLAAGVCLHVVDPSECAFRGYAGRIIVRRADLFNDAAGNAASRVDCEGASASPRALRPLLSPPAVTSRAPAHSRYPERIRGWYDRKRTKASAPH